MDKYIAEADKVIEEEIDLFKRSDGAVGLSLPDPLKVSADEVARYMNSACAGSEMKPFKFGDESDKVIVCLLRQLEAAGTELDSVRRSLSWRLTRLLRWLGRSTLK